MKCVIKLYSKETGKHTNTMMLCGTGSGNFDNHNVYQWVSYPWGTIYPQTFKSKEEALKFFDDDTHVYYEVMRGCMLLLVNQDGVYVTSNTPIDIKL